MNKIIITLFIVCILNLGLWLVYKLYGIQLHSSDNEFIEKCIEEKLYCSISIYRRGSNINYDVSMGGYSKYRIESQKEAMRIIELFKQLNNQ